MFQVFDLLLEASQGTSVDLPNAEVVFPYLGLFTLVTLNPTKVVNHTILTQHLPPLSIPTGKTFIEIPSSTSPTSEDVARIFDSVILDAKFVANAPDSIGKIPISPVDQAFEEKRFWRIQLYLPAVFAALIDRLHLDSSDCSNIKLAKKIYYMLGLEEDDDLENDGNAGPSGGGGGGLSGGGGGPSSGGGSGPNDNNGGGGGSGGGGQSSKRKERSSESPKKGTKKARRVLGGSRTRASNSSGKFPCCSLS